MFAVWDTEGGKGECVFFFSNGRGRGSGGGDGNGNGWRGIIDFGGI
jgi:hypothetical protein